MKIKLLHNAKTFLTGKKANFQLTFHVIWKKFNSCRNLEGQKNIFFKSSSIMVTLIFF